MAMKNIEILPSNMDKTEFILYTTPNGEVKLQVFLQDETLWLTQKKMAELFGVNVRTINEHLQNIFESNELSKKGTIRNFRIVQNEGGRRVSRQIEFYNLDIIIAIGYRVNSKQATHFRMWATRILREYIIKGFAMDDERLKNPTKIFGKDYFIELLERIRSIRASERRIYQKITDIFAECSIDYDPESKTTRVFYAMVQNKFHFAISGQTAAEIIYSKADKDEPFMGLSTWKNAPKGRILSSDVTVAKNYLEEKEIKRLERAISGFFDYIENIIENRQTFTMEAFAESVNKFLTFNEYKILQNKGKISKEDADKKALNEYKEFNKHQVIESDFDREIKKILDREKDESGTKE
jgi:hypothetical protein